MEQPNSLATPAPNRPVPRCLEGMVDTPTEGQMRAMEESLRRSIERRFKQIREDKAKTESK